MWFIYGANEIISDASEFWNSWRSDRAKTDSGTRTTEITTPILGSWWFDIGSLRSAEDYCETPALCILVWLATIRESFVLRCDTFCRYSKGPTNPQGACGVNHGFGLAPLQKFHIDLTRPHRRSSSGQVHLVTGICCFTEYPVVVPLRYKRALTVANALLKHV